MPQKQKKKKRKNRPRQVLRPLHIFDKKDRERPRDGLRMKLDAATETSTKLVTKHRKTQDVELLQPKSVASQPVPVYFGKPSVARQTLPVMARRQTAARNCATSVSMPSGFR